MGLAVQPLQLMHSVNEDFTFDY